MLRVGQLCDRSQGVGILWHFKGMFLTQLKLEAQEIPVQALPASSLDGQEYCANATIFLFRRSVHRDSVTGDRVKPGLWTVTSPVCAAVLLQLEN